MENLNDQNQKYGPPVGEYNVPQESFITQEEDDKNLAKQHAAQDELNKALEQESAHAPRPKNTDSTARNTVRRQVFQIKKNVDTNTSLKNEEAVDTEPEIKTAAENIKEATNKNEEVTQEPHEEAPVKKQYTPHPKLKTLRTFRGDMAIAARDQGESVTSIATAAIKKEDKEEKQKVTPVSIETTAYKAPVYKTPEKPEKNEVKQPQTIHKEDDIQKSFDTTVYKTPMYTAPPKKEVDQEDMQERLARLKSRPPERVAPPQPTPPKPEPEVEPEPKPSPPPPPPKQVHRPIPTPPPVLTPRSVPIQKPRHATMPAITRVNAIRNEVIPVKAAAGIPIFRNIFLVIVSVALIGLGSFAIYSVFFTKNVVDRPVVINQPETLVAYDTYEAVTADNTSNLLSQLNSLKSSLGGETGSVVYAHTDINPEEFFNVLTPSIPDSLLRTFDKPYTIGFYRDADTPVFFAAVTVDSFGQALSGMIFWESNIFRSLRDIHSRGNVESRGIFGDVIIENKDTRRLLGTDEQALIVYGFIDNKTLIITENEAVFRGVANNIIIKRSTR